MSTPWKHCQELNKFYQYKEICIYQGLLPKQDMDSHLFTFFMNKTMLHSGLQHRPDLPDTCTMAGIWRLLLWCVSEETCGVKASLAKSSLSKASDYEESSFRVLNSLYLLLPVQPRAWTYCIFSHMGTNKYWISAYIFNLKYKAEDSSQSYLMFIPKSILLAGEIP